MSLVVNTNMTSLVTQNYLSANQSDLAKATQQLASGLRINSAADDAAGYAIAQRMTSQVNGDNTAIQNTNNAVSLAQTAQGSLAEITNNLQRVRELAVEAANATNSTSDRQSLNNEAQQLLQEVDRVATSASFNGVKLLDGTFTSQQFQVGANAGDTITIGSITSARISSLGASYSASYTSGATSALAANAVQINGVGVGASSSDGVSFASASGSAIAVANAINAASGTGVTATANANVLAPVTFGAGGTLASGDLVINGVNITGNASSASALQALINNNSAATGVTASVSGGALTLTAADGRNITVTASAAGTTATGFATGTTTTSSTVSLSSSSNTGITITGTAGGLVAGTVAASQTGTALSVLDISTVSGATAALNSLDSALNTINTSNASLGAYQNRFQSAVASLQSQSQNLTAARSTIQDADFASATAAETRASVLQQAGVAVLGQANSQPQQILSLLQHL